nr:YccF domain-containing protein [uncultured Collinsella sp.]
MARATRTRGGVFTALYWFGVGCLFCIAIVGIPLGRQRSRWRSSRCCRLAQQFDSAVSFPLV